MQAANDDGIKNLSCWKKIAVWLDFIHDLYFKD